AQQPRVSRQRGQAAHAVWQMDAKERLRLADGSGTSVLTVTDEATGALLGVVPFPPVSLEPGAGAGGAAGPARAVRAVGTAAAAARGQRGSLEHLGRPAARPGALVAGVGDRTD